MTDPIDASTDVEGLFPVNKFTLDSLDLPAAILYLVFNLIEGVAPIVVYYTFVVPIMDNWPSDYNKMYKASWMTMWIGNLIFNGVAAILAPIAWSLNVYAVGIYIAWAQYFVVWGGTILQMINLVLMIAGAATYSEDSASGDADTQKTAWIEMGVWAGVTAGCYLGYWLLNDNFLAYYVLSTIISILNGETHSFSGFLADVLNAVPVTGGFGL